MDRGLSTPVEKEEKSGNVLETETKRESRVPARQPRAQCSAKICPRAAVPARSINLAAARRPKNSMGPASLLFFLSPFLPPAVMSLCSVCDLYFFDYRSECGLPLHSVWGKSSSSNPNSKKKDFIVGQAGPAATSATNEKIDVFSRNETRSFATARRSLQATIS